MRLSCALLFILFASVAQSALGWTIVLDGLAKRGDLKVFFNKKQVHASQSTISEYQLSVSGSGLNFLGQPFNPMDFQQGQEALVTWSLPPVVPGATALSPTDLLPAFFHTAVTAHQQQVADEEKRELSRQLEKEKRERKTSEEERESEKKSLERRLEDAKKEHKKVKAQLDKKNKELEDEKAMNRAIDEKKGKKEPDKKNEEKITRLEQEKKKLEEEKKRLEEERRKLQRQLQENQSQLEDSQNNLQQERKDRKKEQQESKEKHARELDKLKNSEGEKAKRDKEKAVKESQDRQAKEHEEELRKAKAEYEEQKLTAQTQHDKEQRKTKAEYEKEKHAVQAQNEEEMKVRQRNHEEETRKKLEEQKALLDKDWQKALNSAQEATNQIQREHEKLQETVRVREQKEMADYGGVDNLLQLQLSIQENLAVLDVGGKAPGGPPGFSFPAISLKGLKPFKVSPEKLNNLKSAFMWLVWYITPGLGVSYLLYRLYPYLMSSDNTGWPEDKCQAFTGHKLYAICEQYMPQVEYFDQVYHLLLEWYEYNDEEFLYPAFQWQLQKEKEPYEAISSDDLTRTLLANNASLVEKESLSMKVSGSQNFYDEPLDKQLRMMQQLLPLLPERKAGMYISKEKRKQRMEAQAWLLGLVEHVSELALYDPLLYQRLNDRGQESYLKRLLSAFEERLPGSVCLEGSCSDRLAVHGLYMEHPVLVEESDVQEGVTFSCYNEKSLAGSELCFAYLSQGQVQSANLAAYAMKRRLSYLAYFADRPVTLLEPQFQIATESHFLETLKYQICWLEKFHSAEEVSTKKRLIRAAMLYAGGLTGDRGLYKQQLDVLWGLVKRKHVWINTVWTQRQESFHYSIMVEHGFYLQPAWYKTDKGLALEFMPILGDTLLVSRGKQSKPISLSWLIDKTKAKSFRFFYWEFLEKRWEPMKELNQIQISQISKAEINIPCSLAYALGRSPEDVDFFFLIDDNCKLHELLVRPVR